MSAATVLPGFNQPVFDAQASFRSLLQAMSRPGSVRELPSPPVREGVSPAMMAVCLCLLDADTRVWLDAAARSAGLASQLAFHCGAPLVDDPGSADFAIALDPEVLPALDDLAVGCDLHPESSCTLLVQVASLAGDGPRRVRGPGVKGARAFDCNGLPPSFWAGFAANGELYPAGVDVVLACGRTVLALPRTARVEA